MAKELKKKGDWHFILFLMAGVVLIYLVAGFILPPRAHGDELANNATLKAYFNFPGEDCPDGGAVTSLTVRYSLTAPPDTSHFTANCPTLPTTQDTNNATYIAGMTILATMAGKAQGMLDSLTATGLPYDADVWLEADATDDAGNKSATWIVKKHTELAPDVVAPEPVKVRFFR
jgi:hypothetical protein